MHNLTYRFHFFFRTKIHPGKSDLNYIIEDNIEEILDTLMLIIPK